MYMNLPHVLVFIFTLYFHFDLAKSRLSTAFWMLALTLVAPSSHQSLGQMLLAS